MASETTFEEIWAPYRTELRRDWVSLSEVLRRVRRSGEAEQDVQARTLGLLGWVLESGEAVAGQFVEGEFVAWDEPPATVVARADAEWTGLQRDPNPGEVLWLAAPPSSTDDG